MTYYISNPAVNLKEKFVLSFDVKFSTKDEVLGVGVDTEEKQISDISDFIAKINHGVLLDNGFTLIQQSNRYTTDGTYIWNKDGQNKELLNVALEIVDDKVYEEVKDISTYDPDKDMMNVFVKNNKLFKYIPGKYLLEDGIAKLDAAQINVTTIFSFENGKVKLEQYRLLDNLREYTGKLRIILNNTASTLDLAKRVNGVYQNIRTYFFSTNLQNGYIYLGNTIPSDNLSVTYSVDK